MAMVSDRVQDQLRERFASLSGSVELKLYVKPGSGRLILPSGIGCATCSDAREIAQALQAAAPEHISLEEIDVTAGGESLVEEVPTLTIGEPGEAHRIRYQGLPAGLEFATVVDTILRVSAGEPDLAPETEERLEAVTEPIEIMVFATPTCGYCPQAVSLANRMAMVSPRVTSLIVASNEFPDLSRRFGVQGVPQMVVNRRGVFVGALPEPDFVDATLELAGTNDV